MAKVLVVGGAGYVGSAVCSWLLDRGHGVWVLDDLSAGHREMLFKESLGFTQARAGDQAAVGDLLKREKFDCVMHFAAKALVAESVAKPDLYFENNVVQTRLLLETMLASDVKRFIFSSTCAIFGDPGANPMNENCPKNPINPYGNTKLQAEKIMQEFAARGLQSVALRYFNAAGAELKIRVGEWHDPESHLIPRVLKAAVQGEAVEIYGTDYPTPDGTCVRDYIHISDLAAAHEAAMKRLLARGTVSQGSFEAFNLGSEDGYSVRDMVRACEKVTGIALKVVEKERRPGDPPRLVAESALARRELGFKIENDLEVIIGTAWNWELKRHGKLGKAVFLDRDGTINEDPGYLSSPEQMKLLPKVGEALSLLKKAGFKLVVVSNQSGVGRGLIKPEVLPKIHEKLHELLARDSVRFDQFELCLHRPEDKCRCRKPEPKLVLDAGRKLAVDLSRSYMIGDKESDLEAGRRAGCRGAILVRTGEGAKTEKSLRPGTADFIGDSLLEASRWILAQENAGS